MHFSVAGMKMDNMSLCDDALGAFPGTLRVTFNMSTKKRSVETVDQMNRTITEYSDLSMRAKNRLFRTAEDHTIMGHSDQLIPGIPDTVTMHAIVPRMQWSDFHNLAMVSHRWNRAIRSREVHDARVRSHSTETVVVMQSGFNVFLVSTRNKYCYRLPKVPIPHLNVEDVLNSWRWVSLDGKLYVLGGLMEDDGRDCASRKVYVLDLAGQKKWKRCASMKAKRNDFACGVLDGNIYVFGGTSHNLVVDQAEVYDPKENIWSPISCGIWRQHASVATIGEEFIFYGGYDFWDVYNPRKDEWRRGPLFLKNFEEFEGEVFFAQGKFHGISRAGIDVYNDQKSTWPHLHSVCNDVIVRGIESPYRVPTCEREDFEVQGIVAVDDEILVAVCCTDFTNFRIGNWGSLPTSHLFFRSEGLGTNQKEICWHKEDGYLPALDKRISFLCTIQL